MGDPSAENFLAERFEFDAGPPCQSFSGANHWKVSSDKMICSR